MWIFEITIEADWTKPAELTQHVLDRH
jgi:hypothetical protein